jgi:hypothetical protein
MDNPQNNLVDRTRQYLENIQKSTDKICMLNKILVEKFNKIQDILNRCYPTTSEGLENDKFDDEYRSETAFDDIYDVIYSTVEKI